MRKINLLLVILISACQTCFAGEPNTEGFQIGSTFINYSVAADAKSGKSTVTLKIFTEDFSAPIEKKFDVDYIKAKLVNGTPVYDLENPGKVLSIVWTLREKMMGNGAVICAVTDENFKVVNQWSIETPMMMGFPTLMDESYFKQKTVAHLPNDHFLTYSLDAYTAEGGLLYLRYDFNNRTSSWGENDKRIDKKETQAHLYYFAPAAKGYSQKWDASINEEWIVSYKIWNYNTKVVLFTTYVNSDDGKKAKSYSSRIRILDAATGGIEQTIDIPEKDGFEFLISGLTYSTTKKKLVFTGDYITATNNLKWNRQEGVMSSSIIGKVDASGKLVTSDVVLPSSNEERFKGKLTKVSLLHVNFIVLQANDEVLISTQRFFWTEDKGTYSNQPHTITSYMNLIFDGIYVLKFTPDLQLSSSKQYVPTPIAGRTPEIGLSFMEDARSFQLQAPTCERYLLNKTYWNQDTQTLIVLQGDFDSDIMSKKRDIYALKVVAGQESYFKSVGTLGVQGNSNTQPAVASIGYIFSDKTAQVLVKDSSNDTFQKVGL